MSISQFEYPHPLIPQRADPWVYLHTDGYYYFTASVPEYDRIELRRASTIADLATALPVVCWRKREQGPMSANIWAPELHYIDGKWYLYYAAGRAEAPFEHRMYVLECDAANPLDGAWAEKGQIRTAWETFALDATTFAHRGVRYLVWAQRDPDIPGNSNLYLAPMSNPWTLAGPHTMLTTPEHEWERNGFLVNEGAAVLHRNGHFFISYSASATDHHYCMGLLWAREDSELTDPASWTKSSKPVLETDEAAGRFGPGHNSFTIAEDGRTDLLVYHARDYKEIVGDPLYDPNRHTCIMPIHWDEAGMPLFGRAASEPNGKPVQML